jgi:hypothetical protein
MWFPFNKTEKGAQIASKMIKLPPYITKWIRLNAADGKKGAKVYNIIYIDDSKIVEAGFYISKVASMFNEIEGFCWKVEPVMSVRDSLKVAGIKVE